MKNINIKKNLMEIIDEKVDPTKEDVNPDEKIKNLFNKIEFLALEPEQKGEVAQKIKNDANPDKLFWIEIFLSAGIATLWLLQDSVAVIIWAMLIAPLLRPINWLAYSIATWESGFFKKSAIMLLLSIFFSVLVWWFITYILNLDIQTSWILARTNPTILDLFVASLSAIVAILSLKFTRLWESIAGVAMAASLMPPLAVVGIELAFWNFSASFWAFMLFLTNLVAILIVWVLLFWMYGFNPHRVEQHKKVMKRLIFVIISLVLISIPLFHSLQLIKEENNYKKEIKYYVESTLKTKISDFKIEKIDLKEIDSNNITVDLVLKLPENVSFYKNFKQELDYTLSKKLWKNVKLNIELIRMANIVSKVDKKTDVKYEMSKYIKELFSKSDDMQLISFDIQKNLNWKNSYILKIVWVIQNSSLSDKELKEKYEEMIKEKFPNLNLDFIWVLLPKYEQKTVEQAPNPIDDLYKKIYYKWELFLNQILLPGMYFDNLNIKIKLRDENKNKFDLSDIKSMKTTFNLYVPSNISTGELEVLHQQIQKFNSTFSGSTLDIKEFNYKVVNF